MTVLGVGREDEWEMEFGGQRVRGPVLGDDRGRGVEVTRRQGQSRSHLRKHWSHSVSSEWLTGGSVSGIWRSSGGPVWILRQRYLDEDG